MLKSKIKETLRRMHAKQPHPPANEAEAIQTAKNNLIRPHLETLILARLSAGGTSSYAIAQSIQEESGGRIQIPEGSMYPALNRMLEQGYLTKHEPESGGGRPRICYQITPAGRVRLHALLNVFEDVCAGCEECFASLRGLRP